MEKYTLIPEQLLYEGSIVPDNLYEPDLVAEEIILLTHTSVYWEKLKTQSLSPKEERRIGFPQSERLVRRGRCIAQGTLQNVYLAQRHGVAINGAGGTHHAFSDRGEGFCLLNDFAIAANAILAKQQLKQILIVDLDVHQGNGTAEIFEGRPEVFTFSMHCEANYPLHKARSDLDISLSAGTGDTAYLRQLEHHLPALIDQVEPDIVFYLAGVDILATDKLGHLACSKEACKRRDAFVMHLCHKNKVPLVISLGGGYSQQLRDIVEAHSNTFRLAQEIWF